MLGGKEAGGSGWRQAAQWHLTRPEAGRGPGATLSPSDLSLLAGTERRLCLGDQQAREACGSEVTLPQGGRHWWAGLLLPGYGCGEEA